MIDHKAVTHPSDGLVPLRGKDWFGFPSRYPLLSWR